MVTGKKKKKPKLQKWNDCNLIQFRESEARLWHFAVSEKQVTQKSQLTHSESTPLPQAQVEQAWRQFFKKRLNLSWIPSEHLYLRVIDMPACEDREETRQMLEFQLEKISPVPVHQIVWSFQNLPCPDPEQQSLLLVLAQRSAVDGVLSQLESIGYQTDQITFSGLQGLVGFEPPSDCVRISWEPRDEHSADCLISWHIDGWTKDAGLVHVPMDERGAQALVNHLNNAAWSGELEGWLKQAPEVRFEGPEEEPGSWIEAAKKWSSLGVEHEDAPHSEVRAHECAERSVRGKSTVNLMPEDVHRGYRQSYVDGLWWSSLKGVGLIYIFAVGIYFAAMEWRKTENLDLQVAMRSRANAFTNTMALQAKVNILQEQVDLKYSALDSLRMISELMPDGMSLLSFNFRQGKIVTLRGNIPTDQTAKVTDYHESLIGAQVDGKPLFESVSDPTISATGTSRRNPVQSSTWSFNCELRRSGFE